MTTPSSSDRSATEHLSLVVPCYREARRIHAAAEALLGWADEQGISVEVLFVDDGSDDGTAERAREAAEADRRVRLERLERHRGKGAAVRRGLGRSRGRHVIFLDADLAYGTAPLTVLLRELEDGADVVIGRRDLEGGRYHYNLRRRLGSHLLNAWSDRWLDLGGIRDTQCGLKGLEGTIARAMSRALTIDGFGFDLELLFLARKWNLTLRQVPVRMLPKEAASSVRMLRHGLRLAADAPGIRWRDRLGRYPEWAAPRHPARPNR